MKKFIVTYHASEDFMKQATQHTPEEMKKGQEEWMVWADKCGEKLVDMGAPLGGGLKLSTDGSSSFSKREIVGYSILQAESIDDAKSLLIDHPHLNWKDGCEIEVHESFAM